VPVSSLGVAPVGRAARADHSRYNVCAGSIPATQIKLLSCYGECEIILPVAETKSKVKLGSTAT